MAKTKSVTRLRLWTVRILKIGVVVGLGGFFALAVAVIIAMQSLPSFDSLKSSPNGQMIRLHAVDGTVIVSMGPSYGRWLGYGQIPAVMVDALVSTEDKRFYMHPGVDPFGMVRGAWRAIERRGTGRRIEGASTITQQLARNIFLNNSYTAGRKVREIILAPRNGAQVHEEADPRALSQQDVLRWRLLWRGRGEPEVLQPSRRAAEHRANRP